MQCHICEGPTDFTCDRCGEPVCEDCCVTPTYMNQIDYPLCTDCDDNIQTARAEHAEREWKEEEAVKAAKAVKAKARRARYWLPENVAKRAAAKAERKRLAAIAKRERMEKAVKFVGDMFRGMF